MKITSYILLGLLSFVEVLAEQTAFDKAVEAYAAKKAAELLYYSSINADEELKLAWETRRLAMLTLVVNLNDKEAHKQAEAAMEEAEVAWEKALDAADLKWLEELQKALGEAYSTALDSIPEVKIALDAEKRALDFRAAVRLNDDSSWIDREEANRRVEEAGDIYLTVLKGAVEKIEKAYEQDEKTR